MKLQIDVKSVRFYYLETFIGKNIGEDLYVQSVEPAMKNAIRSVFPR